MKHLTPSFRTFSGEDSLASLPGELQRVDATRVVLIYGASMSRQRDALSVIEQVIGGRLAGSWSGAREHSPVPSVVDACATLTRLRADAVIAVGGGSAIVTARAATILYAEKRDVRELCTRRGADGKLVSPKLTEPKVPQWIVPSTPTTAFATAAAAVLDPSTGERLALFDPKARAQGVFFHPRLALTAPAELVRSAALNAFAMTVEGLQSDADDPLAEALLRQSLLMFARLLPVLIERPDDADTRLQLMIAALLCGQGVGYTGGGLAQALSHAAGPRSQAPNGVVEALLLPYAMRYNAPVVASRLSAIGGILALDDAQPNTESIVGAVEDLLRITGVPARLRVVGFPHDMIEEIVNHASEDWALTRTPRAARRGDLRKLLAEAW